MEVVWIYPLIFDTKHIYSFDFGNECFSLFKHKHLTSTSIFFVMIYVN